MNIFNENMSHSIAFFISLIIVLSVSIYINLKYEKFGMFNVRLCNIAILLSIISLLFLGIWLLDQILNQQVVNFNTNLSFIFTLLIVIAGMFFEIIVIIFTKKRMFFYRIIIVSLIILMKNFLTFVFLKFGAISAVWYIILSFSFMGFSYVLFLFEESNKTINLINNSNYKFDVINRLKEEQWLYFKISFQTLLALAASIGVSMSILFNKDFSLLRNKISALVILIGFIGIIIGFLFWIVKPFFENTQKLRQLFIKYTLK